MDSPSIVSSTTATDTQCDQNSDYQSSNTANHSKNRTKTEYKSNFTPFDQYVYNQATDSFVKPGSSHDISGSLETNIAVSPALEASSFEPINGNTHSNVNEPWYKEVVKRNEKANEYRFKSEVGHSSPLLRASNEDLSTRKSPCGNDPLIEAQIRDHHLSAEQGTMKHSIRFTPNDYKRDHMIAHMANNNNFNLPKDHASQPASSSGNGIKFQNAQPRRAQVPTSRSAAQARARSQSSKRRPIASSDSKTEPASKSNQTTPTKSRLGSGTVSSKVSKVSTSANTKAPAVSRITTGASCQIRASETMTARRVTTSAVGQTRAPSTGVARTAINTRPSSNAPKQAPSSRPITRAQIPTRPLTASRTASSSTTQAKTPTIATKSPVKTANTKNTRVPTTSPRQAPNSLANKSANATPRGSTTSQSTVPSPVGEVKSIKTSKAIANANAKAAAAALATSVVTVAAAISSQDEPNLIFTTTEGGNMLADEIAEAEREASAFREATSEFSAANNCGKVSASEETIACKEASTLGGANPSKETVVSEETNASEEASALEAVGAFKEGDSTEESNFSNGLNACGETSAPIEVDSPDTTSAFKDAGVFKEFSDTEKSSAPKEVSSSEVVGAFENYDRTTLKEESSPPVDLINNFDELANTNGSSDREMFHILDEHSKQDYHQGTSLQQVYIDEHIVDDEPYSILQTTYESQDQSVRDDNGESEESETLNEFRGKFGKDNDAIIVSCPDSTFVSDTDSSNTTVANQIQLDIIPSMVTENSTEEGRVEIGAADSVVIGAELIEPTVLEDPIQEKDDSKLCDNLDESLDKNPNNNELLMNVADLIDVEAMKKQEMAQRLEIARQQGTSSTLNPTPQERDSEILLSADQLNEQFAHVATVLSSGIDATHADDPASSIAINEKLSGSIHDNKYDEIDSKVSSNSRDLEQEEVIGPQKSDANQDINFDLDRAESDSDSNIDMDSKADNVEQTDKVQHPNSQEESKLVEKYLESSEELKLKSRLNFETMNPTSADRHPIEPESAMRLPETHGSYTDDIDNDEHLKLSNHLTNSDDELILDPRASTTVAATKTVDLEFSPHRTIPPSRYNEGAGLSLMSHDERVIADLAELADGSSAEIVAPTVAENRIEISTSKATIPEIPHTATFIHPPKLTQEEDSDDDDFILNPSANPIDIAATMSPSSSIAEEMLRLERENSIGDKVLNLLSSNSSDESMKQESIPDDSREESVDGGKQTNIIESNLIEISTKDHDRVLEFTAVPSTLIPESTSMADPGIVSESNNNSQGVITRKDDTNTRDNIDFFNASRS